MISFRNLHYEKFSDGSVKCIEDEIPFELPQGWEWCNLSMIGQTNIGLTYHPTDITVDGTMVLRSSNIINGKLDFNDLVRVNTAIRDNQYVENNDILICARNGSKALVGKCAIINGMTERASFGAFMAIYRTTFYEFVYYFLNTNLFREVFYDGNSTTINQLTQAMIKSARIPLPPLSEQHRIVDKLNELLSFVDTIETDKTTLQDLIKQTKSKILDLAIRGKLVPQDPNDEPASVLLERIRAEKEELIRQGKIKRDKKESVIFKGEDNSYYETIENETINIDDEIPFDLPEGWEWCRLGSYTEKVTDQVASGSFAALRENVPSLKDPDYAIMVKTADFANNFSSGLTYTTKHGYDFLENSNLFGGELIMSNIGSIGKIFIVPFLNHKMTLAPNSIMIRFIEEEHRDYLYHFLKSPLGYRELISITSGTAMLKFNKTDLKTIFIPIPPFHEQTCIVKAIETAFAQLDEIANSIT